MGKVLSIYSWAHVILFCYESVKFTDEPVKL